MSDNGDFIRELKVIYNLKSDEELIIKLYMDKSALLSRVKEARKEIEKVGTEKWKDYKQNHTGSYDEGYSDAADAFVSLLDRLVPEAKGEE